MVAKLVILGIWPLTSFILASREASVTKLVILGIWTLTWFILALRVLLVAKVLPGILCSIFFISALNNLFLQHQFLLHHLIYLNQQEQVVIYQHLIYLL